MSRPKTVNPPKNLAFKWMIWLASGAALATSALQAQNLPLPEYLDWGPTTWNMAGASAASVSDYDAVANNPAGLAFYKGKSSLGGHWQQLPNDHSNWSLSSIDGNQFAMTGFNFSWTDYANITRHAYTLGAAYPTPYGSIGFSGQAQRLTGLSPNRGWHFTSFAGILMPLGAGLSLGAYGKGLNNFNDEKKFPPSAHLGIMYSIPEGLRVAFDADRRFRIANQDWNYSAAADVLMKEYFGLRGGYHWDNSTEYNFWSAGLSIVSPKIELSGFYMRKISGGGENGMGFKAEARF